MNKRICGYLLTWGNPAKKDLQGEYFTPKTQIGLDWYGYSSGAKLPLFYQHGYDEWIKRTKVGYLDQFAADAMGLWVRGELDETPFTAAIVQLLDEGILDFSPGAASHLVEKKQDGCLLIWPLVEASLTPEPAQPNAIACLESEAA